MTSKTVIRKEAEAVFPGVTDSSTSCVEPVSAGIQCFFLDPGSQETLRQHSCQEFHRVREDKPTPNFRYKVARTSASIFRFLNPDIIHGSSIWGRAPVKVDRRVRKKKITLVHGAEVSILGQSYQIVFQENPRKGIELTQDKIIVSHPYNRHHMLLTMWLKQKSLHFLAEQSKMFADKLGVTVGRITTREVRSRWGSCSHQGNLSYSWRLIFAPEEIARYVCAHEVAHRVHMNHSKEFWKTVESVWPDYKEHRQWLCTHGQGLFLFN